MKIVSGIARNLDLQTPDTLGVRPTAIRSRKALFDSLGSLEGAAVTDLFAGSGALGLESASRGASRVTFVELEHSHCRCIEENIAAVRRTGVTADLKLICGSALAVELWGASAGDVIFADPPYAASAELFLQLTGKEAFLRAAAGKELVWEIPDLPGSAGAFLRPAALSEYTLRKFGGTLFLIGKVRGH